MQNKLQNLIFNLIIRPSWSFSCQYLFCNISVEGKLSVYTVHVINKYLIDIKSLSWHFVQSSAAIKNCPRVLVTDLHNLYIECLKAAVQRLGLYLGINQTFGQVAGQFKLHFLLIP